MAMLGFNTDDEGGEEEEEEEGLDKEKKEKEGRKHVECEGEKEDEDRKLEEQGNVVLKIGMREWQAQARSRRGGEEALDVDEVGKRRENKKEEQQEEEEEWAVVAADCIKAFGKMSKMIGGGGDS